MPVKKKPYTRWGKKNSEHPIHAKNAAEKAATKARQKTAADKRAAATARSKEALAKKQAATKARQKVGADKRAAEAKAKPYTRWGKKNSEHPIHAKKPK